jgi:hypothetical protein
VGPRTGLDDVEKRKFLTLPGLESNLLAVQPTASRCTDRAIPSPNLFVMTTIIIIIIHTTGTSSSSSSGGSSNIIINGSVLKQEKCTVSSRP